MRYSIFSLLRQALTGHRGWGPAWRDAEPKPAYDVIIIGGGGHGLATAYYLANEHGITQRRRAGEGLDRLRQCRPQHHHHPLELPAAGKHPILRIVDEALGGAGAGPQLQRDGQPARRAEPLPLRRAARCARPARQRDAHARRRRRTARCRRRCGACCRSSISTTRAFRSTGDCCSRAAARRVTMPWRGAMRAAPATAASTSSRTAR